MKDRRHSEAEGIFAGTNVKITNEGRPYLGSAIGSSLYVRQFVEEKVKGWSSDVTLFLRRSLRVNHILRILHLLRVWPVVGSMSLALSRILTHISSRLKMLSVV